MTEKTENTTIPVTVLGGLPANVGEAVTAQVTDAISAALAVVVAETSASARYSDPRAALRRHPRGTWGVPGAGSRWQTVFSPTGFRG